MSTSRPVISRVKSPVGSPLLLTGPMSYASALVVLFCALNSRIKFPAVVVLFPRTRTAVIVAPRGSRIGAATTSPPVPDHSVPFESTVGDPAVATKLAAGRSYFLSVGVRSWNPRSLGTSTVDRNTLATNTGSVGSPTTTPLINDASELTSSTGVLETSPTYSVFRPVIRSTVKAPNSRMSIFVPGATASSSTWTVAIPTAPAGTAGTGSGTVADGVPVSTA